MVQSGMRGFEYDYAPTSDRGGTITIRFADVAPSDAYLTLWQGALGNVFDLCSVKTGAVQGAVRESGSKAAQLRVSW